MAAKQQQHSAIEKSGSSHMVGLEVGEGGKTEEQQQQQQQQQCASRPIRENASDNDDRHDIESQQATGAATGDDIAAKQSAFKALGWLDRFLAVWILLAMIIGVLLGNFVPEMATALEKGEFVGVSVPIGE